MVQVSAPGKLMLLGEHAVVYRRPCLVTAVDARLTMTLARLDSAEFTVRAPAVGVEDVRGRIANAFAGGQALAHGTRFIESALAVFREQVGLDGGVAIETRSDFAHTLGLGSSSATVACTLFGLANLFQIDLPPRRLFDLGLEAVLGVQRTGSGFDLAAAIYGGTLLYDNRPPHLIVPLHAPALPLMVAYSGVKADTPAYVKKVGERFERWPTAMTRIFDAMEQLVMDGRAALEQADWARLGQLMDMQHGLAHAIGVDTLETARLVFAARAAGAYGAKLSGAGGGDCILMLAPDDRRPAVERAVVAAGGQVLGVTPNAPGVRLEPEG